MKENSWTVVFTDRVLPTREGSKFMKAATKIMNDMGTANSTAHLQACWNMLGSTRRDSLTAKVRGSTMGNCWPRATLSKINPMDTVPIMMWSMNKSYVRVCSRRVSSQAVAFIINTHLSSMKDRLKTGVPKDLGSYTKMGLKYMKDNGMRIYLWRVKRLVKVF